MTEKGNDKNEEENKSCFCIKALIAILFTSVVSLCICLFLIDKNVTEHINQINTKVRNNSLAIANLCKVSHAGTTIHYSGSISKDCFKRFSKIAMRAKEELKESDQELELLVITSTGGVSLIGIEIGKIVYENKLNIEVKDYCMSACANYVFPAGKNKYINKNAVVGWHGGTFKKDRVDYIEEITEEMIREEVGIHKCNEIFGKSSNYCKEDLYKKEFDEEKDKLDKNTKSLYDTLNVDSEIVNLGINDVYGEEKDFDLVKENNYNIAAIRFWTIPIEEMEKYRITNISYGEEGVDNYFEDVCGEVLPYKFGKVRCISEAVKE